MRAIDAEHYLMDVTLKEDRVPSMQAWPYSLPAVRNLGVLRFHPKVTFIVGENGSGKSTLLEAIAVAWGFNAEGGTRNFNFSTLASHSNLHDALRLGRSGRRPRDGFFLRAESFYNVASEIERLGVIDSYGGVSLHAQSHGESFFALMLHRFGGNGFYVLDEPEAALSPSRQMAMLTRLHQLVQQRSQFVIATHSPILMAYPHADILQIGEDGLQRVAYRDTEHYRLTRAFLEQPQRMLDALLDDE
ncbi:Chromosome partition protein Smc [Xanthomonas sp. SS]|uniref:AAA family ATPase n=1 Tax=Xanthomonas sp. SS TaxID=2724122 RepID=UPI001862590D|nr:AAA family ATPase [Xanthomonas sp. SS]QNH18541.1 Chromosome partition protein Smc [Xanthomonas sp. SS]